MNSRRSEIKVISGLEFEEYSKIIK